MKRPEWSRPQFVEINLSAEVGLYQEDDDFPVKNVPPQTYQAVEPTACIDGRPSHLTPVASVGR